MPHRSQQRKTHWHDIAPKHVEDKRRLLYRCGARCYLLPHEMKFPVCDMRCNIRDDALLAAQKRARILMHNNPSLYNRLIRKAERRKQSKHKGGYTQKTNDSSCSCSSCSSSSSSSS